MKEIISVIVLIIIILFFYIIYNCNCGKNSFSEKFEVNTNLNFLETIKKDIDNIKNISNSNQKILKNIYDPNFDINDTKIKELFFVTKAKKTKAKAAKKTKAKAAIKPKAAVKPKVAVKPKATPIKIIIPSNNIIQDNLNKLNVNDINGDINIINDNLSKMNDDIINYLSLQKSEQDKILLSIDESIINIQKTNSILNLQKSNITSLQGNKTLFNDIEVIKPPIGTTAIMIPEKFINLEEPSSYNSKLSPNVLLLSSNENLKEKIEPHKIINKHNKNLFNNLHKSPSINDFEKCQQNWKEEWENNINQIKFKISNFNVDINSSNTNTNTKENFALNFIPTPSEKPVFNQLNEYSNIISKSSPQIVNDTQTDIKKLLPQVDLKQKQFDKNIIQDINNLDEIKLSINQDMNKIKRKMDGSIIIPIEKLNYLVKEEFNDININVKTDIKTDIKTENTQYPIPTSLKVFEKFENDNDWRTEWDNKLSKIYNKPFPSNMKPLINNKLTNFYIVENPKLEENLNNTTSKIIINNLENISNKLQSQWQVDKY